jgi:glutamate N-acetyltransferase/amino-acid N-acetyltransferase
LTIQGGEEVEQLETFRAALNGVCAQLAADVVRNGEGVRHVIRVAVSDAPSVSAARTVGKAIVNSPLFKCAVAGNDPNVGRLMCAIGDVAATSSVEETLDLERCTIALGGREIFREGRCVLPPDAEVELSAHFAQAELGDDSVPLTFPPHERVVEVEVRLGGGHGGGASCTVIGADLTHEYVAENADYRS